MRGDILRKFGGSAVQGEFPRYSAADALENPFRGYPEPIALFGMGSGPALLRNPVFSQRHDAGRSADDAFCATIMTQRPWL